MTKSQRYRIDFASADNNVKCTTDIRRNHYYRWIGRRTGNPREAQRTQSPGSHVFEGNDKSRNSTYSATYIRCRFNQKGFLSP